MAHHAREPIILLVLSFSLDGVVVVVVLLLLLLLQLAC